MSESPLKPQLDRIERRQRYLLALLLYPYLLGLGWVIAGRVDAVTLPIAAAAALILVLGAYLRALYRGRTSPTG